MFLFICVCGQSTISVFVLRRD